VPSIRAFWSGCIVQMRQSQKRRPEDPKTGTSGGNGLVQTIVSVSPRPELKEFIRAFAQRGINTITVEAVQPVLASLESIIEFDFRHSPLIEYDTGKADFASAFSHA
jgi:hypothetical protein